MQPLSVTLEIGPCMNVLQNSINQLNKNPVKVTKRIVLSDVIKI